MTASLKARAVIVGASGGIGRALVEELCATPLIEVVALARRHQPDLSVRQLVIDVEDEATIVEAADALRDGASITRIFIATGLLHADGLAPEKSNSALDASRLMRLYAVNAVGPALVAKHFLPLLPKSGRSVFAALSARVGSIGDNRLGGWHGYRASKAALNQLIRTMSVELARTRSEAIMVGLHPGTVDTRLSQPFQANVLDRKLFTPGYAAERLIAVCDALRPEDSGGVFAWDGRRIPE